MALSVAMATKETRLILKDSRTIQGILRPPQLMLGEVILAEHVTSDDLDKAISLNQVRVVHPEREQPEIKGKAGGGK